MKSNSIVYEPDLILKLFIVIDDMYKQVFLPQLVSSSRVGRKPILTPSELITISVIFSIVNIDAFKSFYKMLVLTNLFTNLPEYSRLLRNIKSVSHLTSGMLQVLMEINKQHCENKELVKIVDSCPLPVCRNKRIFNYKTSPNAGRGISSMGWFYGFKLHVVIDEDSNLLNLKVTPGNTSDKNRKLVLSLFKDLQGLAVADTGYLSNPLQKELLKRNLHLITEVKRNMKKLMARQQHKLFKLRQRKE